MEYKGFSEVFGKIDLSANVKSILKNTVVKEFALSKTTGELRVVLESSDILNDDCMQDFKDDIEKNFPMLNHVETILYYPMENKTAEEKIATYWHNVDCFVARESSCCYPLFKNSKWRIEGDRLIFNLENKSSHIFRFKQIDRQLGNMLREHLGLDYRVIFEDGEETGDYKEKNKRLIENITNSSMKALGINSLEEDSLSANASLFGEVKKPEVKKTFPKDKPQKPVEAAKPILPVQQGNKDFKKRPRTGSPKIGEVVGEPMPIVNAVSDGETVIIKGMIIANPEITETKKGSYIVKFDVTDKTDSITVKMFCDPDVYEEKFKGILKGKKYMKLSGRLAVDNFEHGEVVLMANTMCEAEAPPEKMDMCDEKRVELHLHTQMSMMDAVTSAKDYIERAVKWGHKAIAITDHGVVQAFPEAMNTAKGKDIKILYGCEGYLVNDLADVVKHDHGQSLDSSFVVFDIETTGLKKNTDKIIEIGAVKVENGEIVDRFSVFINPQMPIPEEITKLTSITDDMVADAENEDTVLPQFLDFVGDSVVVAHNADFDTAFIGRWCAEHSINFDNTILDTVGLARGMFPELKNFKLDTVCERLDVILEHHHRAVDDAGATAEIFVKMIELLKKENITSLGEINVYAAGNIDKRRIPKYYHIIIFAKNLKGLRNLYELVSDAHIKYYLKKPKIPKSELIRLREGLILGSACEAGELYNAVYENQDEDAIKSLVEFYDYLEIQPLGNNQYMIGNTAKNGKSVESVEELKELNRRIVELGEKYNKPVCATCDCHFIDPEDEIYRRFVQFGNGFNDVDDQPPLYFRTTDEMLEEFSYLGEEKAREVVITNTNKIADMIENILPIPPDTYPPKMPNSEENLKNICYGKAHEIYGDPLPPVVQKRLDYELDNIIGHGYAVLYIIAQKLVWDSNDHGYIVGSRGSVGSSFAATMAGITEVNPLDPHYVCPNCKYSDFDSEVVIQAKLDGISGFDLPDAKCPVCGAKLGKNGQSIPFQTFLGFDGDKEPDIDLNFSGEDQQRAHKYCESLFGKGYVFKAGTVSTLQDKTVFGYILKYCEKRGITMRNAEKRRIALGCVGIKRSTGQHPGGLMVVPNDNNILNFTPVQRPANDFNSDITTTHFDYHSISGRLLKLDMLGHDVPTILRMYYDLTGVDPLTVPLGDKDTLSLFVKPDALGVTCEQIDCETGSFGLPEFGTKFARNMLIETQPTTFSDLVRLSGLSHGTDVWAGNAQVLIKEGIATLKEVIPTRDEIMVYLINHGVPDFDSFTIMEKVRKGKGLTPEHEALMREHNIPDWYIDSCKKIKYMFPKGHAVAYVTNTFRIGYFKIHYPYAFYAATFSVKLEDFDYMDQCFGLERVEAKMKELRAKGNDVSAKEKNIITVCELTKEMYVRGFKFVEIDIYESDVKKFKIAKDEDGNEIGLLPPLCAIQGFGETAAMGLAKAREEGRFNTLEEMSIRAGIGKKLMESLKECGIMKGIPDTNQLSLF